MLKHFGGVLLPFLSGRPHSASSCQQRKVPSDLSKLGFQACTGWAMSGACLGEHFNMFPHKYGVLQHGFSTS